MSSKSFIAGFLASIFLLNACASVNIEKKDYDRAADYLEPVKVRNEIKVKKVWSKNAGSISKQEFGKLVPSISESGIFTVSSDGKVIAWKRNAFPVLPFGQVIWKTQLKEEISGGVFEGYGLVLIAGSEGTIYALDSLNGELRWKRELEGEVLVSPQGNGRLAVVQMANGTVHGLDFRSGEPVWVYKTTVPGLTLRGTSIPLIEQGRVYAGFASGKVVALDILTGTAVWEENIYLPEGGTELEQVVDVDGNLLIDGDRVFAASYQGKLVALYKPNGRPLWKNSVSNYLGLEKGLNQVYSIEDDGKIKAFNIENGEQVWVQDKLQGQLLGAPAIQLNYLVVGDSKGYVYWLEQQSGKLVAKKYLGRGAIASYDNWNFKGLRRKADAPQAFRIFSKPVVKDGILYLQNQFGALAAYQIEGQ